MSTFTQKVTLRGHSMRRTPVRLLLAAALPLVAVAVVTPAAGAAQSVAITGRVIPSAGLVVRELSICDAGQPSFCGWVPIDPDTGEFSKQVPTGDYRVELRLAHASGSSLLTQTLTITESDDWTIELPALVSVGITAKQANGSVISDASVRFRGAEKGDDLAVSPDLPAFASKTYFSDLTTDADGKASLVTVPDSRLNLDVRTTIDEVMLRLPLNTPSRAWVDAHADVSVVAQARPMRTITVTLNDSVGRGVSASVGMKGRWAVSPANTLFVDKKLSLQFPEGPGVLYLSSRGPTQDLPNSWRIEQPLRVAGDDIVNLTLPDPVEVTGTVKDADNSQPVAGAAVEYGGPANPATLAEGLVAARLFNGQGSLLVDGTDVDGQFRFSVFADSDLPLATEVRRTGVFRTAPTQRIDASGDVVAKTRLPRSVTTTMNLLDVDGTPLASGGVSLNVKPRSTVPFATAGDGVHTMTTNPGQLDLSLVLSIGRIQMQRTLEVTEDTELSTQLPPTHDLSIRTVSLAGSYRNENLVVSGTTSLATESGPMDASYRAFESTWLGTTSTSVPPMSDGRILIDEDDSMFAEVSGLDTSFDRTVVVVSSSQFDGAGAPYILFDPVDSFTLQGTHLVHWRSIDADDAVFTQTVRTPFGGVAADTPPEVIGSDKEGTITVNYEQGTTTCVGATASRDVITGPASLTACRTRPLDDRAFFASDGWKRVTSDDAVDGSYRRTTERGARLSLGSLDVDINSANGGVVALVGMTSPDAGTVRLKMDGSWIGRRVSLQGPANDEPTVLPVRWVNTQLQGKLHVVVLSDGKPVRIDGIGIAAITPPALPYRGS